MKIIKTEKYAQSSVNPLDGKTNEQARVFVRKIIPRDEIKGLFSDAGWSGVHLIFAAFDGANLDWNIESSNYYPSYDGNPMGGKKWNVEINFVNKVGKISKLYCRIVASGAGTAQDPLSKYDVIATVN